MANAATPIIALTIIVIIIIIIIIIIYHKQIAGRELFTPPYIDWSSDIHFRIQAPGSPIPLISGAVKVIFDGVQIGEGNTKRGIDVTTACERGPHTLKINLVGYGITIRSTTWKLEFNSSGLYIIQTNYSLLWGKYTKRSGVVSGPFPIDRSALSQPARTHSTSSPFTRSVGDVQIDVFNTQQISGLPSEAYVKKWAVIAARGDESEVISTHDQKTEAVSILLDYEKQLKETLTASLPSTSGRGDIDVVTEAKVTKEESRASDDLRTRFERGPLIARGGMAEVYEATERRTGEKVVWKQAHGEQNPLYISNKKLRDENELLQYARHPRIPHFIASGVIDSSGDERVEVLIQEFIEGGDLKNTIEQVKKIGLNIPLEKVTEYICAICEPLEYMAGLAEPVYHRDLKPHNIIVHPLRGPVLIDFGLAKMVASGEDVSITRGGSGTWTSPERDAGVSGPFTDVYSLGKILYYLLTNETPSAILTHENIESTTTNRPKWLADLCLRAAWPDYSKRVQTVEQFRILLQNEGVWPEQQSVSVSASDEYTTWS